MAEKNSDSDPPSILKRQAEENQKVYLWDVNQSKRQRRVKFLLNEEQQQRQVKLEMGDLFLNDRTSRKRTYMYRDEEVETLNTRVSRWNSFRNAFCCCCTTTTCCGRQRLVSRRPAFTNIVIAHGSHKAGKAKRDTKLEKADGLQEKDDDNVQSDAEKAQEEDVLPQEKGTDEDDVYPKKEGEEGIQLKATLPLEKGTENDVDSEREEDIHFKEFVKEVENVSFNEARPREEEDVPRKEADEKREGDDDGVVEKAENANGEDEQPVKKEEKATNEDDETWEDAIADTSAKEEESSEEIMEDHSIDEKMNAIVDIEEKMDDETKPKRGKLSRIRRFLRRLCCCCGSKED